jgi:hypothetical protein
VRWIILANLVATPDDLSVPQLSKRLFCQRNAVPYAHTDRHRHDTHRHSLSETVGETERQTYTHKHTQRYTVMLLQRSSLKFEKYPSSNGLESACGLSFVCVLLMISIQIFQIHHVELQPLCQGLNLRQPSFQLNYGRDFSFFFFFFRRGSNPAGVSMFESLKQLENTNHF